MRYWLLLIVVFVFGCSQKIHPAFYDVVKDHTQLLDETNDAVIGSIQMELDENRATMTPEDIKSVEDLIYRLKFLKAQGKVINDYVQSNFVDREFVSDLIKYRWKQGTSSPNGQ